MATQTQKQAAWAAALADRWEQGAKKFADLAASIPDNKLDWSPTEGVRTCGEVIRHTAYWVQYVAAKMQGKPADDSANELPLPEFKAKKKALDALQRAAGEMASALRDQPMQADAETVTLAVSFIEHNAEHYGQLVVYARMLGIVPPVSR